jgi:hypothetical protein
MRQPIHDPLRPRAETDPYRGDPVSPKQPTVDEFLAALAHARRVDIDRLRSALLASDCELGERIKWNAPSFGHDGNDRVTFRLQPADRFELVLHRGAVKRTDEFSFDDPHHQVTWAAADRGTVPVPDPMTDTDEKQLVALANRWLEATR